MSEITIVTAFFDIGRSAFPEYERSVEEYVGYFRFWARMQNRLVVYTSSEHAERVMRVREEYGLGERTTVIVNDDVSSFDRETYTGIQNVMNTHEYLALRKYRENPECVFPLYNYIVSLKPFFVADAVKRGLCGNTAAWLDFGYNHGGVYYTNSEEFDYLWSYECEDKIHFFAVKELENQPVREIVRDMATYFAGGVTIAPACMWHDLSKWYREGMMDLIRNKLVDDDQTLQVIAYRRHSESICIHHIDTYLQVLFLTGGKHLTISTEKRPKGRDYTNEEKYKVHKRGMRYTWKRGWYLESLKNLALYAFYKARGK